ncbi:hypothetical protein [Nitratifractor salsuginis]|uniref:Uncharacterized protein n=1 Tax=Nitratifractor salsuginis (strain DSM 16511 / JCM 12458 / E9I37-1) TaxID=749222 RepID=E6X1L7_NITSE|nr:hypothetical protein [Nitratifractor salsuginis]ADV47008.1 hypothetical protein Nitsa_1763 [Nitratifractor salsuginis DSM 16511]
MKLIRNKDRLGYGKEDKWLYRGYKTEDGAYYILEESDGYSPYIHVIHAEDYPRIYDEYGNKIERISKFSIASVKGGLSEEQARKALRKVAI